MPFYDKEEISRDKIALVCVGSDLLIVFLMYISLILLENFQKQVINDVQESILTADDFTVCLKEFPRVPITSNA